MSRPWSDEETATARALYLGGATWKAIGARLKRHWRAVQSHTMRRITRAELTTRLDHDRWAEARAKGYRSMLAERTGWPELRGSHEERDNRFVVAVAREADRLGLVRRA